jgi:tRNA threonylcarbamoyladenosine biosynthesis protein TsaE
MAVPSLLFDLPDVAATEELGGAMARGFPGATAPQGSSVHLSGELGAGKTACVRSLLRSFGVSTRVRSPTYSLIETYVLAALTVVHVDLYRLRSPADLDDLGLREQFVAGSLILIEWPVRAAAALPPADLELTLDYHGAGRHARLVVGSALGGIWLENLLRDSRLMPYLSN